MYNLDSCKNSAGKIWLNVASSTFVLKEFVNLDNHIFLRTLFIYESFKHLIPRKYWKYHEDLLTARNSTLLIQHDCRKPLLFPDASVDHILCSHFLEHVFPDEMECILKDFRRVLKPGGTLHVIVPDLADMAKQYLSNNSQGKSDAADRFINDTILSKETKGSFTYRLLEFVGGFGLQHRWMYDYSSMATRVENNGFSVLSVNDTPSKEYRLNDDSVHVIAINS
jgi:predicted SAM-dependent methyltransferase